MATRELAGYWSVDVKLLTDAALPCKRCLVLVHKWSILVSGKARACFPASRDIIPLDGTPRPIDSGRWVSTGGIMRYCED